MNGGTRFPEKNEHVALQQSVLMARGRITECEKWEILDPIDTSSIFGRFFWFERSLHFLTSKVSWVPPSPFLFLFEMLLLFASLHFALPPRREAIFILVAWSFPLFRSRKMNTPSLTSHTENLSKRNAGFAVGLRSTNIYK